MANSPELMRSTQVGRHRWGSRFFLLLAFVGSLRIVVLLIYPDNLTDDRDAYLALARQVAEGNGFRTSENSPLTAYRPPLYPVVLSIPLRVLPEPWSVALVNLICSLVIVALVWRLAHEFFDSRGAWIASGLVAIDPLLLMNATLPMTELMFTALVMSICLLATRPQLGFAQRLVLGVLMGLAALCRPTIWAYAGLASVIWCVRQWRDKSSVSSFTQVSHRGLPVVAGVLLTITPWVLRNFIVFQSFLPMTTHGGYTLLLANNPVFYEDVVAEGWRTTWQAESLERWQRNLQREMIETNPPVRGEVSRSAWMTQRAVETIRNQPGLFLRSCGVRCLRFWNPIPISTPDRPISSVVQGGIGLYSILLFLGVIATVFKRRDRSKARIRFTHFAWIMIISLTLVHAVFWSNMRMRTPLEPLLALLAIPAISRKSESVPSGSRDQQPGSKA